jgi:outer membrane protein OmpA-like peptidoglycan-associated protein
MRINFGLLPVFVLLISSVAAQDIEGSKDHPVVSRYPGSTIQWYVVDNHRPYRLPVGPVTGYRAIDKWIDTAGRVSRIYYALDGGNRTHSEVYKNYMDALQNAKFEILAEGLVAQGVRGGGIGSRQWQGVFFGANPFNSPGPVNEMTAGTATSGGSGTIIAKKTRPAGTAYVAVSVYQFRDNRVSTLVDVIEVEAAETGLIVVNAEAIGAGIKENGRVVLEGILFDFDKATLKPESKAAFDQIAVYLKANPDKNFYVVGHTDSKGTFPYNQKLSSDRARAVVDALIKDYGIASARLEPHGIGPLAPVFANASDASRERNRRVELVEH